MFGDALGFLDQKLKQGLSDVEQWGSDVGNDVTNAIHSVFGTTPQQVQQNQQRPTQAAPQTLSVSTLNPQNTIRLQTQNQTAQQQQQNQNPLLKVNVAPTQQVTPQAPPPPTVPISQPKNPSSGGLASLAKIQLNTTGLASNKSNPQPNNPSGIASSTPAKLPSLSVDTTGALTVPKIGDIQGLSSALNNIDKYDPQSQARILSRGAQSGLVPKNVASAYIVQLLSPEGVEKMPSKSSMLGNAVADVATFGLSNLARRLGTNLGASQVLNQAQKGKLDYTSAMNTINQAEANVGTPMGESKGESAKQNIESAAGSGAQIITTALAPGSSKVIESQVSRVLPDVAGNFTTRAISGATSGALIGPAFNIEGLASNNIPINTQTLGSAAKSGAIFGAGTGGLLGTITGLGAETPSVKTTAPAELPVTPAEIAMQPEDAVGKNVVPETPRPTSQQAEIKTSSASASEMPSDFLQQDETQIAKNREAQGLPPEPPANLKPTGVKRASDVAQLSDIERIGIAASKARTSPDGIIASVTGTDRVIANGTGQLPEEVAADRLANVRNIEAESAVLDHLRQGGTRDEAIKIYQDATGASPKMASYRVRIAAKEADQALHPNATGKNPLEGQFDFPVGDAKQAIINRQRAETNIDSTAAMARRSLNSLSPNDKANFVDYMQKTQDWHNAENPQAVSTAMINAKRLFDTVDALDKSGGGRGRYIQDYFPDYWDLNDPKMAKAMGFKKSQIEEFMASPEGQGSTHDEAIRALWEKTHPNSMFPADDLNYGGFHAQQRLFGSRAEGIKAGYTPMFEDPVDALDRYSVGAKLTVGNQILRQTIQKNPELVMTGRGHTVDLADGSHLTVSKDVWKVLKNVDTKDTRTVIGKIYDKGDKSIKQTLVGLSVAHPMIISPRVLLTGPSLREVAAGLPRRAGAVFIKTPASYIPYVGRALARSAMEHATQDGTLDFGARIGTSVRAVEGGAGKSSWNPLKRATFDYALPQQHLTLIRQARNFIERNNIDPDGPQARAIGTSITHTMGYINEELEGKGAVSRLMFAPQLVRSTLASYRDLFRGGGASMIALTTILGSEAMFQFVGAASKAIANEIDAHEGKKRSPDNWVSTFWKELLEPQIYTPFKNDKGEPIILSIPGQYAQKVLGIVANAHEGSDGQLHIGLNNVKQGLNNTMFAGRSTLGPIPGATVTAVTGKNYAGVPVRNPNAALGTQAEQTGINIASGTLPINLEGFASSNIQKHLPSNLQGAIKVNNNGSGLLRFAGNTIGLNPKVDTSNPQSVQNTKYYTQSSNLQNMLKQGNFGGIDPSLKGVDSKYGPYWYNEWLKIHPQSTVDVNGVKYPTPYDPTSFDDKYNAYTMMNSDGGRSLSPVFYVDKQLQTSTPGYPTNPIFKLSGNGTAADGSTQPKALIALEYEYAQTSGQKDPILNANGGQNGWLSSYENEVGTYAQNYVQNLTSYFKGLGWDQQAIDQYWQSHPSTPNPLQYPQFDQTTNNLLTQYYQYLANGDSTSASTFFTNNATALGNAFDAIAQHTAAKDRAGGLVEPQGYPTESDHVKSIIASWPTGADSASKKIRAISIQDNPDVNQYLADVALYGLLSKGAQFQYRNPSNMSATEGQNINAGGLAGQGFLKDLRNAGIYDVGYNKNAPAGSQYSFMQGGTFPAGAAASGGSGSGGNRFKPLVPLPKRPKKHLLKVKRPPKAKGFKKVKVRQTPRVSVGVRGIRPTAVLKPTQVARLKP